MHLLHASALAENFGAAREKVEAQFLLRRVLRDELRLFQELLSGSGKPLTLPVKLHAETVRKVMISTVGFRAKRLHAGHA